MGVVIVLVALGAVGAVLVLVLSTPAARERPRSTGAVAGAPTADATAEETAPEPTPFPTATATATPTATPTLTPTPSPAATPTPVSATASSAPTATPTPRQAASPVAVATRAATATPTPTSAAPASPTPRATATPTATPRPSPTPKPTPVATTAPRYSSDLPVLFIHGYTPRGAACDWDEMVGDFRDDDGYDFRGEIVQLAYYTVDSSRCDLDISGYGSHDEDGAHSGGHGRSTTIRHRAYHLNRMIWDRWSRHVRSVDVVAHSMGVLLTRYAISAGQRGLPEFRPIRVTDVITLGTPHQGVARWLTPCRGTPCAEMAPGSPFMEELRIHAQDPQGAAGGTEWTIVGSDADDLVTRASAIGMRATHRVVYLSSAGIEHLDYYRENADTEDHPVDRWAGRDAARERDPSFYRAGRLAEVALARSGW